MILFALLAACQPAWSPTSEPCITAAPDGPFAVEVSCNAVLMGSDGRSTDFHLGNRAFTSLVRHPTLAVSAVGVGGMTVVDAAPWGGIDQLLEAIPLVADGWMEVTDFELLDDGLRVFGNIRDLPDRPSTDWGAPVEITWRVHPELPLLTAEGAQGMYLLVGGPSQLRGNTLAGDDVAYGFGGSIEDLGGAIRASSPELWIAPGGDPYVGRGVSRASGASVLAEHIELYADEARLAVVPVIDGLFDFAVPEGATSMRAVAVGRSPSESVPIAEGVSIEPGEYGAMQWLPSWGELPPQGARAVWSTPEGIHEVLLPPTGGTLPIGPQPTRVQVHSRPDLGVIEFDARPGDVRLSPMTPAFDVGSRLLAAPTWPSARSRTWRGSNDQALDLALASGLVWVVMTPEDAVGPPLSDPPLLYTSGVLSEVDGQQISSWPYTNRPRQDGWGAPNPQDRSLAMAELSGTSRIVEPAFLGALGLPFTTDTWPTGVLLSRPDAALDDLAPWFAWLDEQAWLPAYGPRVWVDVPDPTLYGYADIEQALVRGNSCATTGPLLILTIDGTGSGEVAQLDPDGGLARVEVRSDQALDRLVLVGSTGRVLADWDSPGAEVEFPVEADSWWVAIGWSADHWAVTSPVLGI